MLSGLPYSAQVTLPNPQGMHARPATALAQLVKSRGGTVTLRAGSKSADATRGRLRRNIDHP